MSFQFEKLSVLLVEDVLPMKQIISSVLKSLGIKNITETIDGEAAFKKFQKDNHDIIITDWVMSPIDGIELTKEIRHNPLSPNRMAPIIFITGYSAWERVEYARDVGVTEFLIKPFTAQDLGRRIAHVITNPRDFVETKDFFGPDRRRRIDKNYKGPFRRDGDAKSYSAKGE
jgi:CheY-like chemotaxis protein